jgi:hypothetical protein
MVSSMVKGSSQYLTTNIIYVLKEIIILNLSREHNTVHGLINFEHHLGSSLAMAYHYRF